jgi:hypothetical protein
MADPNVAKTVAGIKGRWLFFPGFKGFDPAFCYVPVAADGEVLMCTTVEACGKYHSRRCVRPFVTNAMTLPCKCIAVFSRVNAWIGWRSPDCMGLGFGTCPTLAEKLGRKGSLGRIQLLDDKRADRAKMLAWFFGNLPEEKRKKLKIPVKAIDKDKDLLNTLVCAKINVKAVLMLEVLALKREEATAGYCVDVGRKRNPDAKRSRYKNKNKPGKRAADDSDSEAEAIAAPAEDTEVESGADEPLTAAPKPQKVPGPKRIPFLAALSKPVIPAVPVPLESKAVPAEPSQPKPVILAPEPDSDVVSYAVSEADAGDDKPDAETYALEMASLVKTRDKILEAIGENMKALMDVSNTMLDMAELINKDLEKHNAKRQATSGR